MKDFWNERYREEEFVYGTAPNIFFAEQLSLLKPGKLLLPCEGEGRNAVFAAQKGWSVQAFDMSEAGKEKAQKLADVKSVCLVYDIKDATSLDYADGSFDAIALIYAHFPPAARKSIHKKMKDLLKKGGKVIVEAFTPAQLGNASGGPKNLEMLYTEETLRADFEGMGIELLESLEIHLDEGKYHSGKANVVRLVATKVE